MGSGVPKHREKAINSRVHAKRRFEERYGVRLTREEYTELVELARHNTKYSNVVRVERQSAITSIYGILWKGVIVLGVFDHKRHEFKTFLHPAVSDPEHARPAVELYVAAATAFHARGLIGDDSAAMQSVRDYLARTGSLPTLPAVCDGDAPTGGNAGGQEPGGCGPGGTADEEVD